MNGRSVRGNMPAFSNKIDQKEAESLVNFVRRLRAS
jgi:mono/diheme cytochrome c family protein